MIRSKGNYEGIDNSLSDKQAYDELKRVINEKGKMDKPFFVSIYTFGTHVGHDSPDEQYGNGKNNLLNKFYNVDYQFGKFFEGFKESDLADDTIIILTGDHCAYGDVDYSSTFPDYTREDCAVDIMPLSIWFKGVESNKVYVNGRNSLDLTPTILDLMDIDCENYFLGTSLYNEDGTKYDTIFECEGSLISTSNKEIIHYDEGDIEDIEEDIYDYFVAKKQQPLYY